MKKRKAGILLVLVGAALLGAALLLLFYNQREDQAAGEASEEGLAQVQEAITKVLYGGQSYQIGSRKLTRADLTELRAMEKELKAEVASESNSSLL